MSEKIILHKNYTLQEKSLDLTKESLEGGGKVKRYEITPDEGYLLKKVTVIQKDTNLLGFSVNEKEEMIKAPVGKTILQTLAMITKSEETNPVYYYCEPEYDELICVNENKTDPQGYLTAFPGWLFLYMFNPVRIDIGAHYIKCLQLFWGNAVATSKVKTICFSHLEKVEYKFTLCGIRRTINCSDISMPYLKTVINGFYSNMNDTALITGYTDSSSNKCAAFNYSDISLPSLETFEIRQSSGQRNALIAYISFLQTLDLCANYSDYENYTGLKLITNSVYKGCYLVYRCPDLTSIFIHAPLKEMGDRAKNHYLYLCDTTCVNLIDLCLAGCVECDLSLDYWNPSNALDNSKNDLSNDERMTNRGQFIQNFIYDILYMYSDLSDRSSNIIYKIYVCDAVYQALFDNTTCVIDRWGDVVFDSVSDAVNGLLVQKGVEIVNVG